LTGLGKSSIEYATPTFKVKKLRESRTVVFVVDTSNSMAEENRLYLAKQVKIFSFEEKNELKLTSNNNI